MLLHCAMFTALKYLVENPEEARAMGRRGKQKFDRAFGIDQSVASLIVVYRAVTAAEAAHEKAKN